MRREIPTTRSSPAAILTFVGLVLVLSWLRLASSFIEEGTGTQIPAVIADIALPLLAAFGPLLAAIVVSARRRAGEGTADLLRQGLRWRAAPVWYLAAIGGPPALFGVSLLLAIPFDVDASTLGIGSIPAALATFGAALVFAVGEDFGWRGYLQRALQSRWTALAATLGVGLVWAAWHAPLFLEPQAVQSNIPPLAFLALGVGVSVLLGWLYNSTGGGLPLVLLAHAAINASLGSIAVNLESAKAVTAYVIASAFVVWLAVAVVVATVGPRRLARAGSRIERAYPPETRV